MALIVCGIVSVCVRGINFGLDFKPGMVEEIKVADPVLELSYSGSATINFNVENDGVQLVVSGIGADNRTVDIPFAAVKKVSDVSSVLLSQNMSRSTASSSILQTLQCLEPERSAFSPTTSQAQFLPTMSATR